MNDPASSFVGLVTQNSPNPDFSFLFLGGSQKDALQCLQGLECLSMSEMLNLFEL